MMGQSNNEERKTTMAEQGEALWRKMAATGVTLGDHWQIYRGLSTGLNQAFVIDQQTRDTLVRQNRNSAELLKPYISGRDIKPWRVEWRGMWLIRTRPGLDMAKYPAILDYLRTFKPGLEQRRNAPDCAWYEIPVKKSTAMLEQPKVIYPAATPIPKFVYDEQSYAVGQSLYFIPTANRYLQGLLGSRPVWFYLIRMASRLGADRWHYRLSIQVMQNLPVPTASAEDRAAIAGLAQALARPETSNRLALEAELNERIAILYGLTEAEEKRLVE